MHLLSDLGKIGVVMLAVYLMMKIMDGYNRQIFGILFLPRTETYLYWLEMVLGVLAPLVLLSFARVRQSQPGLFLGSLMIILGFVINRLNVAITGMQAYAGSQYFPSWMEISITMSIVTCGFIAFYLAAKYLPVFQHEAQESASGNHLPHGLG